MRTWLQLHVWQLALGVFLLAVLTAGILIVDSGPTEADTGMPADQQAYWSWVGSINQDPGAALGAGVALLEQAPHLNALYLRLANVCRSTGALATCRDALQAASPADPTTALYREAALTLLLPDTARAAAERWQELARQPALDPALARLIVDQALRPDQQLWLENVETAWHEQITADTTRVGATFGLGYIAVRRSKWDVAEPLLHRVTRRAPDDSHAYRELGRIYYETGQHDRFDAMLAAGIDAAEARHDLEQALILRGNLAWNLIRRSTNLEQAEQVLKQALEQSRTLSDEATEGFNLYRLAQVFVMQERHEEALALLDSADVRYARHAPRQQPEVTLLRAIALSQLYRFSEAEDRYQSTLAEAEAQRNVSIKAQALLPLMSLRIQMGRYEAARTVGFELLALTQKYRMRDIEAEARLKLGDLEIIERNIEEASAHFEAALDVALTSKNDALILSSYQGLGRTALSLKDPHTAKIYFDKMLERAGEGGQLYLGSTYPWLAYTYWQFRNHAEALRYIDLALDVLEEGKYQNLRVSSLYTKVSLLVALERYEGTEDLLDTVEQVASKSTYWLTSAAYMRGWIALRQGRYAEALEHLQRSLKLEQGQFPRLRFLTTYRMGISYWRLGQPDRAEAAFKQSTEMIGTWRENLYSFERRATFVQNKIDVYKHFSAFLDEQGRTEDALYYTEQARSRTLVDLLYTTQQGQQVDAQRPADRLIEMERRVRALAERIAEEPFKETGDESTGSAARRTRLRLTYEQADSIYRRALVDVTPEQEIYTFEPLRPAEMRALLNDDEAMIVYDLRTLGASLPQDASVVYVVLPDTVIMRPLALKEDALNESIRFFLAQIRTVEGTEGADWEASARRLFQDLVAPVLPVLPASVRHLNLIPEGLLHYVPFAALLGSDGRFLIERFTLSIAPSASTLKLSRDRNPGRWRTMLLVADPDDRLPGSRREVLAVQKQDPDNRTVLLGAAATQARIEADAGHYDILHLATHGRFVSEAPWRSHLDLHDDVLSVEEVGHLDLHAYLVTLSACESALSGGLISDIPRGDEWIGLNQAFLAAGTPTVMASLWPIDDRVSSSFIIHFYDELRTSGKAPALAQTQRLFLKTPHTRHPFYWAPFTIIGDPL